MTKRRKRIVLMVTALLIVVGLVGGSIYMSKLFFDTTPPVTETKDNRVYSRTEVRAHSSDSDCWTIIRDGVYDITAYILRHPGGDEILRACGIDATSLFEQRTTTSGEPVGSGGPHSTQANDQLNVYKIGTVEW